MINRNWMQKLINDISASLEAYADDKRIEFAKRSYPTKMRVIGVTVPNLKVVLKELKIQTKDFEPTEKLQLVKNLVDSGIFEMQQLAFEYIQSQKKLIPFLKQDFIKSIEKNLDNWISVDYYAAIVVGTAWREGLITSEEVRDYLNNEDFWIRRIAVVATVSLNQKARGGRGDSQRTLDICKRVVLDHEPMIVKALSWALRELAKTDRKAVISFLDLHQDKLHKKVIREVNNKIETGLKNR